jgi:hypothetical protein
MTADRWRMIKGLFQRALKLPPEEWPAYLDSVSAGDAGLRREVASLLAEHEPGAVSLLGDPGGDEALARFVRLNRDALAVDPEDSTDGR